MDRITGGCLCGNVRIAASGLPYRVGLCHSTMLCDLLLKATRGLAIAVVSSREWKRRQPGLATDDPAFVAAWNAHLEIPHFSRARGAPRMQSLVLQSGYAVRHRDFESAQTRAVNAAPKVVSGTGGREFKSPRSDQ
jgi:hypothetical protein